MSYPKTCTACETAFETDNYRQQKCRPSCGRTRSTESRNGARAQATEDHEVEFIGVDGEGVTRAEWVEDYDEESGEFVMKRMDVHHYVLLSVGARSIHNDGSPLTHHQIFRFLYDQFLENPEAAFVGFFLGYDFTMWLKTIPEAAAWSLLTKDGIEKRTPTETDDHGRRVRRFPFPVRDGHWRYEDGRRRYRASWEFDSLAGKRFKLRPYVPREEWPVCTTAHKSATQQEECDAGRHRKHPYKWMSICDSGPFFQKAFIKVIVPSKWPPGTITDDEFALILAGKERRKYAEFDSEMIRYNVLENEILSRVMRLLNRGLVAEGIRLPKDKWFGPGQAAQAWMRDVLNLPTGEFLRGETREQRDAGTPPPVPPWAREAARKTYYGGWFEIFNHGPVPGTSYAYDINSAYPYIIASLPCLLHGKWTHHEGRPPRLPRGAIRMVLADVAGKDEWVGAMPHRTPTGSILRPWRTRGWYWWHEAMAARRAGLITRVTVHEAVTYEPCDCPPPVAGIREMYLGRLRVGKETPHGMAMKFVYNSAYGKLAQSVGEPRFSNPVWASLITAGTRCMILDAIATHPTRTESLLMVATDAVYFKEPHPSLDLDAERLGAWGAKTHENLSLFMPGLYWDDAARNRIRAGQEPELKSRGVRPRDLAHIVDIIDRQWRRYGPDVSAPKVRLRVEFAIVTAKQAIVRDAWHTCGQMLFDVMRDLDGDPKGKRWVGKSIGLVPRHGGLRSRPYPEVLGEPETTYYERGFGDEVLADDEVDEMVTPDGMVGELRTWAFGLR